MKNLRNSKPVVLIVVGCLLMSACAGASDTTSAPATAVPAAATQVPPTATEVPPTATEVPPTPTEVPPTEVPPTATEVPPTPTQIPPTEVPPTATEVPPTEVPLTATEVPAPTETPTAGPQPTVSQPTMPTSDGAAIFATSCAGCHGAGGAGTGRGPSILGIGQFFPADASPLVSLVTNGGTNMPEFGTKLTTEQIAAVVQYVVDTFQ